MQYSRCNKFVINMPGSSQCESDTGTDIPRISNQKNCYARLIKNLRQSASKCTVSNINKLKIIPS